MSKQSKKLMTVLQVAMLIAIQIILSRHLSIATPFVKIGFGFVPLAVCGMLFGPVWAGVTGGVADFLGATLFPIGAYFPGFTLSELLTGVVYGLCLHRRPIRWFHIVLAVGINNLIISMFLTTYWIHILYGTPYWSLMPLRIFKNIILICVEFIVLRLLKRPVIAYAAHVQVS